MTIDCFNNYHLGDCLFSVMLFNVLIEKNPDLIVNFGCVSHLIRELKLHAHPNINFISNGQNGANVWIQGEGIWGQYANKCDAEKTLKYYDEFYLQFNEHLSRKFVNENYFHTLEDTLYNHKDLETRRYPDYDILLLNAVGYSGQYQYLHHEFVQFTNKLSAYKVISTEKLPNVPSTREMGMNLLDLANLSLGCKCIIGVHTSPYVTVLNKKNVDTVKRWVVLNDKTTSYKVREFLQYDSIKDVDIEKIIEVL